MWTFLFVIAMGAMLYLKISELRSQNELLQDRLADLQMEIRAVRQAFLRRISALEDGSTTEPIGTPVEVVEEVVVEAVATPELPTEQTVEADPIVPFEPTPEPELPASETPYVPVFESAPAARSGIEWERLIGVRGAAILAAVVLGLAALLFLQYSIENGLIPPIVRVAIGLMVGAGAIAGSEVLRKRGYVTTANALAGGGVIVLYASIWAAKTLYDLIGMGLAFGLMTLVTATCGMLSWRNSAREIAVLGLAGGFATPLLLSSGQDNPIGLFGYLLLLNAALFALARNRGWPLLSILGVLATTFYQAGWITTQMGAERGFLGLTILGLFACLFVFASRYRVGDDVDAGDRTTWQWIQSGAVLLPFLMALHFAARADLGEHLYPVAGLMALLSVGALLLDRVDDFPALPLGTAAATVGVVALWHLDARFDAALSWESLVVVMLLAVLYHVFQESWLRPSPERGGYALSPALVLGGGLLVLQTIMPLKSSAEHYLPWLLTLLGLALLLIRQAWVTGRSTALTTAAVGSGVGLGISLLIGITATAPDNVVRYTVALLAAAAFQIPMLRQRLPRHSADFSAALIAMVLLVMNVPLCFDSSVDHRVYLGAALGFGALLSLAATRLSSGPIYLAATAVVALSHTLFATNWREGETDESSVVVLGILFGSAAFFTLWPLLVGGSFLAQRWTVYAAALAGPLWFVAIGSAWEQQLGTSVIGIVPLVLGALSLAAAVRLRQLVDASDPAQLRGLVWFAGVAISFVALAIPLQLEKEWITIGWAIQAFALLHLWKRLDHPGLKYFALALAGFTFIRLMLNPEIFEYHARSGRPIINWLMYGYLVPAAALIGGANVLRNLELARARPFERLFYQNGHAWGAIKCFAGAILIVFAWVNLTIFDAFSSGRMIEVSFERLAARDLTLSFAWAVFALGLLALAFRTKAQALRWTSLAFLLLTIGKVFLHDLGELEDLYRVASLVGLAMSLLLVSVAYQRFVFRDQPTETDE